MCEPSDGKEMIFTIVMFLNLSVHRIIWHFIIFTAAGHWPEQWTLYGHNVWLSERREPVYIVWWWWWWWWCDHL